MKITSIALDKAVSDGPIDAFSHALLGDSPTLDEVLEYLASRHAGGCWRMWSRSLSIRRIGWNGARWRAR